MLRAASPIVVHTTQPQPLLQHPPPAARPGVRILTPNVTLPFVANAHIVTIAVGILTSSQAAWSSETSKLGVVQEDMDHFTNAIF
jgi:hypothetical protein